MRQLTALWITLIFLAACTTPEATLKRGYDIVSGSARTATVLVQREAITPDDGQRILIIGDTSKASLDSGKEALKACRAAGGTKCARAVANINLGSGLLLELEKYLKANEATK